MAKHHPDLIFCRKQPGVAIGRLCEKCDGRCVICDSYVRPCTLVRICDECNYGSYQVPHSQNVVFFVTYELAK
jgi:PHD finger-like domain-containing protein 5A